MLLRYLWLCMLVLALMPVNAQTDSTEADEEGDDFEWFKPDMNTTHKFGVKIGVNTSTMLGGELENPRAAFGLNGSIYYRYRFTEKSAIQADLGISLRGSNFANPSGQYGSIKTYHIDVPVTWVRSLNSKKTSHLVLGAQYSYLLNAYLYIKPSAVAESEQPKLKKDDILLLAGSQFYAGVVGFQIVAKYGLININNGLISGLNPPFKNKDIHNFALEVNFLF